MFIFNKRNIEKRILKLLKTIDSVSEELHKNKVSPQVLIELQKVKERLDDRNLVLSKNQLESFEECLSSIASHAHKEFETLLNKKIQRLNLVMKGDDTPLSKLDKEIEKNDDLLIEAYCEINNLLSEKKDAEKDMEFALKNDNQFLWESKKNECKRIDQVVALKRSYLQSLSNTQNNLISTREFEKQQKNNEVIESQMELINIAAIERIAQASKYIGEYSSEVSDKIQNIFDENFKSEGETSEYQRAHEAYLSEKKLSTNTSVGDSVIEEPSKEDK